MYYEIIRADGSTKFYKIFTAMLDDFDRQDVLDLYRLVKERFEITSPEGYDRLLWGDLITLFEPKPKSLEEAIKDKCWTMAMHHELNQLARNNVWELVPPPSGHTIIELKWSFEYTLDENGIVRKTHARCSQEHLEGDALDPWIPTLEQGKQRSRGSIYNDIYSLFYKDINLPMKDQDPAFLI
ncbi:retrovirus-related pol polyprotein from transposon TNT 1-94 [Tanacetum coccineum]